jgi:hypothetical protein
MKILPLSGNPDRETDRQEMLKTEFGDSRRFGEIRIGSEHLFYRSFIRIRYIPLKQCQRIYLRVEFGEYGEIPLHEHYLIVQTKQGKELVLRVDRPEDAKGALAFLEENVQEIALGKEKAEK